MGLVSLDVALTYTPSFLLLANSPPLLLLPRAFTALFFGSSMHDSMFSPSSLLLSCLWLWLREFHYLPLCPQNMPFFHVLKMMRFVYESLIRSNSFRAGASPLRPRSAAIAPLGIPGVHFLANTLLPRHFRQCAVPCMPPPCLQRRLPL